MSNIFDGEAHLVILEQPSNSFRFRYKSEMVETHGSIMGERSEKFKKTFPEVELRNFNGKGVICCSLFQTNMDKPSQHPHKLVVSNNELDNCDPLYVHVSPKIGYIARFEGMKIINTVKKDIQDVLYVKNEKAYKFESRRDVLSELEINQLKYEAERERRLINLNQVRLYFEAFEIREDKVWRRIAEPVFSNIINHSKSSKTDNLKICYLSIVGASAAGGDLLQILTNDKVNKNIKARFLELDGETKVWEAFAENIHNHRGVLNVLTPPYEDDNIETPVNVFIELERTVEGSIERSMPVGFRYMPRNKISRKRKQDSDHPRFSLNSSVLQESEPTTSAASVNQGQESEARNVESPNFIRYMQQVETDFKYLDSISPSNGFDNMLSSGFDNMLSSGLVPVQGRQMGLMDGISVLVDVAANWLKNLKL